jgi:hypothetical protein
LRIPCFFKPGIFEAACVVAVSESKALGVRETVEFLVDTGASRKRSVKDVIRSEIDFSRLEKLSEGLFGTTLRMAVLQTETVLTGDL